MACMYIVVWSTFADFRTLLVVVVIEIDAASASSLSGRRNYHVDLNYLDVYLNYTSLQTATSS